MKKGDRVNERYKILHKIGSGGMANVYLAEDLILEREVAVKMMALDFRNDKDSLRRFQREAMATVELSHPNLVNIYDVGEGEHPYIVMEYVEGMDLKEYITHNHPISYKKAIDIMSQILDGIAYAHENDVIHRDIKPHNILIDEEGNVKITDFGIAVALSQNSITQTNSLLGSVQYMSPEQARGNIVTKQSDIYSLGIVLYELLTGSVPFDGESAVSIALKHFQSTIPSLREFDSRIPQALENVVLKATTKESKNRYKSISEMKEDLATSLSPDRRGEARFEPIDPLDEDTLVLNADEFKSQLPATDEKIENPTKEVNKKPKNKKKKRLWLLLIPLILILAFVGYSLTIPAEVVIPEEIIGMPEREAIALLEESSLLLGEIIENPNEEVEEGLVYRADPDVGNTVKENSEVDLYISLGKEPFTVEDYRGEEYEKVRADLTEIGFIVEMEKDSSEEYAEGEIISQDIKSGEEIVVNDTVITFVVSTGRASFSLRDLNGYTKQSVKDYVKGVGLNLTIEEQPSDEIPVEQVITQEPAAGETLYPGDHLTVTFSTGEEKKSEVIFSENVDVPYEEKYEDEDESELIPSKVEIYIEDLNNSIDKVAQEHEIVKDSSYVLQFVVEEGEKAKYLIKVDGKEIMEKTVAP